MGRLASMKPGYSAPYGNTAVVLLSTMAAGLGRQFEVGRDGGANGWSWCRCLAPKVPSERGPAMRGADACRCSP